MGTPADPTDRVWQYGRRTVTPTMWEHMSTEKYSQVTERVARCRSVLQEQIAGRHKRWAGDIPPPPLIISPLATSLYLSRENVGPFVTISSVLGSDNGPMQGYRQHCLMESVGPFEGIGSIDWEKQWI